MLLYRDIYEIDELKNNLREKIVFIDGCEMGSMWLFLQLLEYGVYVTGFVDDTGKYSKSRLFNKKVFKIEEGLNYNNTVCLYVSDIDEKKEEKYIKFFDKIVACPFWKPNHRLYEKKVIIYGTGTGGIREADVLKKNNISICCFADSDKQKEGTVILDIPVISKETLLAERTDESIVIASQSYREIASQLINQGVDKKRIFVDYQIFYNKQDNYTPYPALMISREDGNNMFFGVDKIVNEWMPFYQKEKRQAIYGITSYTKELAEFFQLMDIEIDYFLEDEENISEEIKNDFKQKVLCIDDISDAKLKDMMITVAKCDCFAGKIEKDERASRKLERKGLQETREYRFLHSLNYPELNQHLDPNLGYMLYYSGKENSILPGYRVFGKNQKDDFRIVTLGNSLADANIFPDIKNWNEILAEKLSEKNVTIYAGGKAGYTAQQELTQMIRDVGVIHPDLVISFSGCHNWSTFALTPYPYLTFSQKNRYLQDDKESFFGVENYETNYEFWVRIQKIMKAVADTMGFKMITFLQPCLATKEKLSPQEEIIKNLPYGRTWMEYMQTVKPDISSGNLMKEIKKSFDVYFKHLREEINDMQFVVDLSESMQTTEDTYIDYWHLNDRGNEIIANNMLPYIEAMKK